MMAQRCAKVLLVAVALLASTSPRFATAEEETAKKAKTSALDLGKVEESESKAKMEDPNGGYVGGLGSFVVSKDGHSGGLLVVHNHPDTKSAALGHTKLTYKGAKRLGNVDGYVFETQWDGKAYPSKMFFSAEKVYFGGGVNAFIAADYRESTGWAWKLHPLRKMAVVKDSASKASTSSKD